MRRAMASGAAWMILFRLCDRSIGFVSTALLARLLLPADFGLVAMAMSIIALIDMATSFSFEIALIQKADPSRDYYDTAWTLNIAGAVAGACLTVGLSAVTASFYEDPRLVQVMLAIGAGWLISGFENVGTVNFRRRMDFASEFRFLAWKRLITFLVTIAAALTMKSYWALVIGMVTGRIVGIALSFAMEPFRPRFSLVRYKELLSFTGWLQINKLVGAILGKAPSFFVGRMFGAQALGAYTVGAEIGQLAHTELVAPINRAMFAGYSRMAIEPASLAKMCVEATAAVLLVVLPASVGLAVLAEPMVRVLLGEQWHAAVPIIQILAFAGAAAALTSNNVTACLAMGQPHLSTVVATARLLVLVAAAWWLTKGQGIAAVAYAELIAAVAGFVVSLPILLVAMKIRAIDLLGALWRPLIGSCAMGAAIQALVFALYDDGSFGAALLALALGVPIGALLYAACVGVLWQWFGRRDSVEAQVARRIRALVSAAFPGKS
ncbi:MAG: oligosaccharide flippase family protein [Betaproteobacteria bacterium]